VSDQASCVRLGDGLPAVHLARFAADIVSHLDLSALYARDGTRGGEPSAPEILLGLLFHGCATGDFASRKIEQGTKETAAYGRKCTVEPTVGQMKETMGFRQFSLRGLRTVSSEGRLVCLSINLRRKQTMACS
jgi:transposase